MPKLTPRYSIHTLDHELLFSPGTLLTQETLNVLIDSHRSYSNQTYPLLSYGSVKENCLSFLSNPPYDIIFSDKNQINDFLNILETAHLTIPILQSLDYFKQHDFYTYAHTLMVFALSTLLAKDLMPDYQECIQMSATGPTHDFGKICVPLKILQKTTPLTKTERSYIEHHAVAGYVLLSYYYKDILHLACKVSLDHHERRDGLGYPRGILPKDPLVEIIAVSDIYDALIKPRPYRSTAYNNRAALEEMTTMAKDNKIGWDVFRALIAQNRKSKPHYREIKISTEKRATPPSHNVYGITTEEEKIDSKD